MSPAELAERMARAELEMFYLLSVEEGVRLLQWMEKTGHPLMPLRECSEISTRQGS